MSARFAYAIIIKPDGSACNYRSPCSYYSREYLQ